MRLLTLVRTPHLGGCDLLRAWPRPLSSRHKYVLRAFSTSIPIRAPPQDPLGNIRNIGIIAHVDAGKTTTTESMLYNSGATRHRGEVDTGNTVTDFLPMERARGITIQSAAITFSWPPKERLTPETREHFINLIDTPGHVDFRFEVERCMPVLDGAVCILDGVEGVEAHTERVWASAKEFSIPRFIYVNKMDRTGASFKKSVQDIGMKLNGMPLVCQIPYWEDEAFAGVLDVINRTRIQWGPKGEESRTELSSPVDEVEIARERLIESLCDKDDELLEAWTSQGKDLSPTDIKKAIRRVISDGSGDVIPVLVGTSLRNIGVTTLLDAVLDYLPSPSDRPELEVRIGQSKRPLKELLKGSTAKGPKTSQRLSIETLASVFKVVHDPHRGMMTFVRVYSGALKKNAPLWNSNLQAFEKPISIMQISADKHRDIVSLAEGQIGALTGLKQARTGDTLLSFVSNKPPPPELGSVKVRPPDIPPAVAFLTLDAYSASTADLLEQALESMSREDPSLRWSKDEKTEQYTLSGMGKLHLEVARDRLETYYKVTAEWGAIQVDYKECVISPTEDLWLTFEKTLAGKAGKVACSVQIEPLEEQHRQTLSEFAVERDGNVIEVKFSEEVPFDTEAVRPLFINGVIAGLARGPRRGSPLSQCLVTVTFDTQRDFFGEVSSAHYSSAANQVVKALLRAAHKTANIGILEPVMKVAINLPETASDEIQHDLHSSRGGQVLEVRDAQNAAMYEDAQIDIADIYAPPDPFEFTTTLRESRKGGLRMLEIIAHVPLSEMLDYDSVLRSRTQGRHSLTMNLDTFQRVTGPREMSLI